jgi:hypothetical protein
MAVRSRRNTYRSIGAPLDPEQRPSSWTVAL